MDGPWIGARAHRVDQDHGRSALPRLQQRSALAGFLEYGNPGRKLSAELARHENTYAIIAAEVISDSNDAQGG